MDIKRHAAVLAVVIMSVLANYIIVRQADVLVRGEFRFLNSNQASFVFIYKVK